MKSISTKISPTLFAKIRARAVGNGVTISTYVAALLDEHLTEPPLLGVAPRPSGLTAASKRTRKRVSRAGVKSRENKETDRG